MRLVEFVVLAAVRFAAVFVALLFAVFMLVLMAVALLVRGVAIVLGLCAIITAVDRGTTR